MLTVDTSDVDLLEHLDIAVANEEERLTKWGASPAMKSAVVNRVEADPPSTVSSACAGGSCGSCDSSKAPSGGSVKQPKNDHNPILNKLGELQVSVNEMVAFKSKFDNVDSKLDKVAKLEKELADLKKYVGPTSQSQTKKARFQYGCTDCKAKGKAEARRCRHCFNCGSDAHKRDACPN